MTLRKRTLRIACVVLGALLGCQPTQDVLKPEAAKTNESQVPKDTIRFATFNLALNRPNAGALVKELAAGDSEAARQLAEVIQVVRPDVILLNELDYDEQHQSLKLFHDQYLAVGQNDQKALQYEYQFTAAVNTGVPTEYDLDGDGETGKAADCFGYGRFPGQYGMAVLSRFPIDNGNLRTFQKFLWSAMPDAMQPGVDGQRFYDQDVFSALRLSSKSHWDVPIQTELGTIHFLVCHPTPPVFDGPEDRNGRRNHDEIRFFADYISSADYIVDDQGKRGGLESARHFVIAGDLNADPNDGDSASNAIRQLTEHALVNNSIVPSSAGAAKASEIQGQANTSHSSPAEHDTGDFPDERTGNLRIDYVLPSRTLTIGDSGVFWPAPDAPHAELADVSDHHLVWIDIKAKAGE